MRILYVEDNQANLFLVQRFARMGGHEVITYMTGESALENFDQDQPNLILMDIQLSGELSGLDVVKRIRARGSKTPIIAVTAYAMVGDRERCMEAGCDSYLSKPLPVTELVEIIRKYESRATAELQAVKLPDVEAVLPPAPASHTAVTALLTPPATTPADASPIKTGEDEETHSTPPDAEPTREPVTTVTGATPAADKSAGV